MKDIEVKKPMEDLVDHYWGAINYIFGLIKASEIKAGLILSFYGIVLNLIYQGFGSTIGSLQEDELFLALLMLWFNATVISIYFSFRCFMPRIESNYEKNVFFFGDIISSFGDIKSYSRTLYEISTDELKLFEQLGEQIFINSKIASEKFKNVNHSLRYLSISLILLLLIVMYYFVAFKTF